VEAADVDVADVDVALSRQDAPPNPTVISAATGQARLLVLRVNG
jgi:hypothetical protein